MRDLFFNFLFPAECFGCGKNGAWACGACLKKIRLWPETLCIGCGAKNAIYSLCPECQKKFYLKGLLIAGDYENRLLSDMIKAYKYRFQHGLAEVLVKILARSWRNQSNKNYFARNKIFFSNSEEKILIPVPLHRRRQNWRGFNQSEDLCKKLGKIIDLKCECAALKRIKYQKPQAGLKAMERKKNILDCFDWQGTGNLEGKTVILIDDVSTTAATLDECAKILKNRGASEVWGFVIAKG